MFLILNSGHQKFKVIKFGIKTKSILINLKGELTSLLFVTIQFYYTIGDVHSNGALHGGAPMSHVDFKKWQCRMSLLLIFSNVTCRIEEKAMSQVGVMGH